MSWMIGVVAARGVHAGVGDIRAGHAGKSAMKYGETVALVIEKIWEKKNHVEHEPQFLRKNPETWILDLAFSAITIIDFFGGFGEPTEAECVEDAAAFLENGKVKLHSAQVKSNEWSGAGADACNETNKFLQHQLEIMMEQDLMLKTLVHKQAHQVEVAHQAVEGSLITISVMCVVAIALYKIPVAGAQISTFMQVATATATVLAVLTEEILTFKKSAAVSTLYFPLIGAYEKIVKDVNTRMKGVDARHSGFEEKVRAILEKADRDHAWTTKPPKLGSLVATAASAGKLSTYQVGVLAALRPEPHVEPLDAQRSESGDASGHVIGVAANQPSTQGTRSNQGGSEVVGASRQGSRPASRRTPDDGNTSAEGAGSGADSAERAPIAAPVADSSSTAANGGPGTAKGP